MTLNRPPHQPLDRFAGEKLGHRIRGYRWPMDWLARHDNKTVYDFLEWHRKERGWIANREARWNWRYIARLMMEDPVNIDALDVFYWMVNHMDKENHLAIFTGTMQADLNMPKERMMRTIRLLIEKQWVIRLRGKRKIIRTRFVVNPDLCRKDHNGKAAAQRLWRAFEKRVQENPNVG